MNQVLLHRGQIKVHEVSAPLVDDHVVLVRVHYSYISTGTEAATVAASTESLVRKFSNNMTASAHKFMGAVKEHGLATTFALINERQHKHLPLGYACSGQVVATGARVDGVYPGDFVVCAGAGFASHAEMVAVPQQLVVVVKKPAMLKQASITTIGAIALQGVRRAQLELGQSVCVIGLGLIGQITVQLAKRAGCTVYAIDLRQDRLALAKQGGADVCLNPLTDDIVKEIEMRTAHHGVDASIITAAASTGNIIQQAMQTTRRKGKVVLVGDVKIDFDREPFYSKEIDLLISCSYGPGRYDASYERESKDYPYAYVRWTERRNMAYILELIEQGLLRIDPLITGEYPLHDAATGYSFLQKTGALGIVLRYSPEMTVEEAIKKPIVVPSRAFKAITTGVRLAVVGVGGFAKVRLLPMLKGIPKLTIHSIVDTDAANAMTVAQQYGALRVGNDLRKVAADDDVNAVVIATPHAQHVEQVKLCLQAGKAVLVEKPLAVTNEQLLDMKRFLQERPQSFFMVDFNRSWAPFNLDIKKAINGRTNALMISYRMSGNYLPKDHWIQSELHRGRIVGEACHIFELFCFLTDAQPVSVHVAPLRHQTSDLPITDNIYATVTFTDGSVCSLLYTVLGHGSAGKEYMEVYVDGKTIILDDYYTLKGYGLPATFSKKATRQDKGHEALFESFFKAATVEPLSLPVSYERALMATEISLVVDKLARQGGGFEVMEHL
ncbi:zinc-binding dehydrogenase [Candidatus Dependentiae bacterium]|nr:zinc-binding dehydrogenase [Candidatus Dependentiae bacterium]